MIAPSAQTPRAVGRLQAFRVRWLGERDAVDAQLADMARQGAAMARVAHVCAAALLVLFSAASFVALGGDTLTAILAEWRHGRIDIPAAISLSVITLMVLAFDVGMLYAASMLRLLATRRAGLGERWVHVLVMVSVASIEASTYCYMAWRYERPLTWLAWALIVVRAAAAPLLAVYLSMARPLPVTARDILAQTELASGAGVLRDVVSIANDTTAPLAAKVSIYGASAVMAPAERTRLDTLLEVVQRQATPLLSAPARATATPGVADGTMAVRGVHPALAAAPALVQPHDEHPDPDPPTPPNGHKGAARRAADDRVRTAAERAADAHRILALPASNGHLPPASRTRVHKRGGRPGARRTGSRRTGSVEALVHTAWTPGMSITELERAAGISRSTAAAWRRALIAEETARALSSATLAG